MGQTDNNKCYLHFTEDSYVKKIKKKTGKVEEDFELGKISTSALKREAKRIQQIMEKKRSFVPDGV